MDDLFDYVAPMKALSLWQPWASLMAAGVKIHETRHWSTNYRGMVAIHAAKTIDVAGAPEELCAAALGRNWDRLVPIGMIMAVGRLVGCDDAPATLAAGLTRANAEAGNFTVGRYAWRFENLRALRRPIPINGRQGLWNWTPPEGLEANLHAAGDHRAICERIGWA